MSRVLVPIQYRITKGVVDGQKRAIYPDFNKIAPEYRGYVGWSVFFTLEGACQCHDKVQNLGTGHHEGTGAVLVPAAFAREAVRLFPQDVRVLTAQEWETFYDTRACAHLPDEDLDITVLEAIRLKKDLGIPLTTQQQDALNPYTQTPGIRKNVNRWWRTRRHAEDIILADLT